MNESQYLKELEEVAEMHNKLVDKLAAAEQRVKELEKHLSLSDNRREELRSMLHQSQERERVLREALEHCLEVSAEPEKYGRYLSTDDREIIKDALAATGKEGEK